MWNLIQKCYKHKSYIAKPIILKDNRRWLWLSERHNYNLCNIIKSCNFQWSDEMERRVYINLGNNLKMKPNLFVLKQQLLSFLNYIDKDFFLNEWMSMAIYSHLQMPILACNKRFGVSVVLLLIRSNLTKS